MAISYKQKCAICKKNFTLVRRNEFPICYECQKKDMEGEIKDPEMKKMFDIPEEYFKESSFLRSIKINYLRYGELSEKQVAAFVKVVGKIKEKKEKEDGSDIPVLQSGQ